MPRKRNILTIYSPITNLPPELFALFYHQLIYSFFLKYVVNSVVIYVHQILLLLNRYGKNLDYNSCPKVDMPPPKGMNEKQYVELLMKERGCQICKCNIRCEIYWVFEVRCCIKCFFKN